MVEAALAAEPQSWDEFNPRLYSVEFRDAATAERIRAELLEATSPKRDISGKAYYGTGHLAQLHDFVEAVRKRRAPGVTVADAAKTASFIFDIYASQRKAAR